MAGSETVTDVKFMILGNGRVGKTQICRRLRNEDYDEAVTSTHGVQVTSADLGAPSGITLRIWDFGGQDIYHGTHALFLKSRAIFPLVWSPETEVLREHEHGGFTFRNQPLGYWFAFVQAFGHKRAPILILQTRCDDVGDEQDPPLDTAQIKAARDNKRMVRTLSYSAKTDRGRAALDANLMEAAEAVLKHQGARIGLGRAKVKAQIEAMQDDGRQLLPRAEFDALCDAAENISSKDHFLDYLHNTGAVFYRRGLFGDRILLDQAWALDAVYAAFDREKSYGKLLRQRGRFTRSDLAEWVWEADPDPAKRFSVADQDLFLEFMRQCDICFVIRKGDKKHDIPAEYIAPDMLPERDDAHIAAELRRGWDDGVADAAATLRYDLLPPGFMRSVISKIGDKAGLDAVYWRDGVMFYDGETASRALIEQNASEDDWSGTITVTTQRGQAGALLKTVLKLIDDGHAHLGAKETERDVRESEERTPPKVEETSGDHGKVVEVGFTPARDPAQAGRYAKPTYFVSYAWSDTKRPENERLGEVVDLLDATAKGRGIRIIRDIHDLPTGESIEQFMRDIGTGDRVFIVLSEKYLKSAYCMYELFETARNNKFEPALLRENTRVFAHPCAKISQPTTVKTIVDHWRSKKAELEPLYADPDYMGPRRRADYLMMHRFIPYIAQVIDTFADVVRADSSPDAFVEHALEGCQSHGG